MLSPRADVLAPKSAHGLGLFRVTHRVLVLNLTVKGEVRGLSCPELPSPSPAFRHCCTPLAAN